MTAPRGARGFRYRGLDQRPGDNATHARRSGVSAANRRARRVTVRGAKAPITENGAPRWLAGHRNGDALMFDALTKLDNKVPTRASAS